VWLPHGVTTQKTPFFIVTAVKTSNLTEKSSCLDIHKLLSFTELLGTVEIFDEIKWYLSLRIEGNSL
jgi:hypothetical protein